MRFSFAPSSVTRRIIDLRSNETAFRCCRERIARPSGVFDTGSQERDVGSYNAEYRDATSRCMWLDVYSSSRKFRRFSPSTSTIDPRPIPVIWTTLCLSARPRRSAMTRADSEPSSLRLYRFPVSLPFSPGCKTRFLCGCGEGGTGGGFGLKGG